MCEKPNKFPRETRPHLERLAVLAEALRATPEHLRHPYEWQYLAQQMEGEIEIRRCEDRILARALDQPAFWREGLQRTYESCSVVRFGDWLNREALVAFFGLPIEQLAMFIMHPPDRQILPEVRESVTASLLRWLGECDEQHAVAALPERTT